MCMCVHTGVWCKNVFLALGSSQQTHWKLYCLGYPTLILMKKLRFKNVIQDHRAGFWHTQKQSSGFPIFGNLFLPCQHLAWLLHPSSLSRDLLPIISIRLSFKTKQNTTQHNTHFLTCFLRNQAFLFWDSRSMSTQGVKNKFPGNADSVTQQTTYWAVLV